MSEEIVTEEEVLEEEVEETTEPEAEEPADEVDWEARAKKAEALIVKNKQKPKPEPTTKPPEQSEDIPEWGQKILSTEEKRSFGYAKGYAPETVDALFKYNSGTAPTDDQLDEDDAMKGIVKTLESKRKNAANTPRGVSTPTYKGKTYADTVTDAEASKEDKQAAFEAQKKARGIT